MADAAKAETENKKEGGSAPEGAAVAPSGEEVDFKDISIAEAFKILECSPKGLTSEEHQARLEQYGPNKLPEGKRIAILVFLGYMWNPLSWAMECAAIAAIVLLDYVDFVLILSLLLCNASISYIEESSADKAIKALTSALAPRAKAVRNGKVEAIEAVDLVPGDVIVVRIGDIVPADIKLLGDESDTSSPLQVDQAALTGESLPVKKFPGHIAFSGSTIKQGEQEALVYATGKNTFFGRAAALIAGTNAVANIQKVMTRIGAVCLITIGIWVVIEVVVGFVHWKHYCYGGTGGCPLLTNVLVIVVGGIPIAMPTVLSVTLALGAAKLAKEGAIVARMSAVEEMAGMSILCSDKTGTLTLNKLSVDRDTILFVDPYTQEDVLMYAALSSQQDSEEAIDIVLVESYPGSGTMWRGKQQYKYTPFNPNDKYTVSFVLEEANEHRYKLLKGAPQVVLRKSANKDAISKRVEDTIVEFANRGYRALGVAISEGAEKDAESWQFVGLLPLWDPPRHDTKETVENCLRKGISVKMVTGDQLLIGKEVARQLGMGTNMYTTDVLIKAKEGHIHLEGVKDVDELVEHADGFAEVFPEHKYAIVEILQKRGHMVGMTGDGVNDAPALKRADVGVAVAGATEAARGAADIVLTEAGLSTIVTAIIGARKIFQRMNTYAKYTIAMTFRICFTFGILTAVYDWFFPTLLIVLLAVFNDGAMIALSKDRVLPSELPNVWRLSNIFITGIVYGIYLSLSSWSLWYLAAKTPFFLHAFHLPDMQQRQQDLQRWCQSTLQRFNIGPQDFAGTIPEYAESLPLPGQGPNDGVTMIMQCEAEQKWFRESMLRSMLYLQVSVSGQALVFVVRCTGWSFRSRAGMLTYLAFFGAQMAATIIAIFGFNGFDNPRSFVKPCIFCRLSSGGRSPFFSAKKAPQAHVPDWTNIGVVDPNVPYYQQDALQLPPGSEAFAAGRTKGTNSGFPYTESVYTDSIIGCTSWVLVAWVWSFIWHIPLDLIKWGMAYVLNEDGFRTRMHGKSPAEEAAAAQPDSLPSQSTLTGEEGGKPTNLQRTSTTAAPPARGSLSRTSAQREADKAGHVYAGGPVTWTNPLGRHSMSQATPQQLERASVMSIQRPGGAGSTGRSSVTGGK